MTAKETINQALARYTGYHLTKGRPGDEVAGHARIRNDRDKARRNLSSTQRDLDQAQQQIRTMQAQRRRLPKDFDDEAKQIIQSVRKFSMTSPVKLFTFISAVRYITAHQVPGDIVECGVWRGGSMQAAAKTLLAMNDTSRELYLFDTYEGMPPPTDADVRADGESAAHLMEVKDKKSNLWAIATLDDVQTNFAPVGYPKDKVHFVKGLVEDTVPGEAPEQISILRLDTDWYESTAHELATLYDRLSPGGVLLLDDYGWWAGSRKAVDEFMARTGEALLLVRMEEGRVAVKPWK